MIWATVSSRSCFCWLYRASPSSAAKNIINLTSVKCYLSLEDQLRSLLPLLPSPTSSPGIPGSWHFPDYDSICVEFLQLQALGRGPFSSLLFLLLQSLQGTLQPPEHSLAKTRGVGPVTGTWNNQLLEDTAQPLFSLWCSNSICFPCLSGRKALSDRLCYQISEHFHLQAFPWRRNS